MEKKSQNKNICTNKKAFHDYIIHDKFEAGIVLSGCEIKSVCEGKVNLQDGYAVIDKGELLLHNMFISHYINGTYFNLPEKRIRKLLMHKKEILKISHSIREKGFTLIPLSLYKNKYGKVKVELALVKGKHNYDKRESLKDKTLKRELNAIK
jgi:SsrA-binding protein